MKRFIRFLVVGAAAVFTSHLDAAPAHSIRVVLPSGADGLTKHAGEVLARQIAKRCDVAVRPGGEADLRIELATEKGISPEGYRIAQTQQSMLTGSEVSCVPAGRMRPRLPFPAGLLLESS